MESVNDEDKLFMAKILDKIKLANTKNRIENTDFLDMHQKNVSQKILNGQKEENYIFYEACKNAEKLMLIIYPEKYDILFKTEKFDYSSIVKVIRIELPNELKGQYSHKDYLSGIMKLGVKREKVGDILVFENGADIVVCKEIAQYVINNLQQLTRFSKAKIEEIDINKIREPIINKEEIKIIVPALRLDCIVSELANCSRTLGTEIIANQRVFVNYENETRNSRTINLGDIIVIRGKGKFVIKDNLRAN